MGRIKGGGTDCLMLLAEVFETAGVIHASSPVLSRRIGTCIAMRNGISKG